MPKALSTLTVGEKVEIPINSPHRARYGNQIAFRVAAKNHAGYPANSVTLIPERLIQIIGFDGMEANSADSNRRLYGNNRYLWANLRRWLNSNANAGQWYTAAHSTDAPPNAANISSGNHFEAWAGFLQIFPSDFVNALLDTNLIVARNTVVDGGSFETVTDKFFLASTTEVGLANENSIAEGSLLPLFSDNASRICLPTAEAVNPANNNNYTSSSFNITSGWHWWLRTPIASDSYNVRNVNSTGTLTSDGACNGYGGLRPLCNLPSAILVSDNVNSRGNYEFVFKQPPPPPNGISVPETTLSGQNVNISWGASVHPDGDPITYFVERAANGGSFTPVTSTAGLTFAEMVLTSWNTLQYRVKASIGSLESAFITSNVIAVIHNRPPEISGQNGDLGTKGADFGHDYVVTDADMDVVTVTEAVSGNVIRTFDVTLDANNTARVEGNDFVQLAQGNHALTITAKDTANNITVRTMTFTKHVDGFTITLDPPLEAFEIPTRCNIIVHREIPPGATFKVEATNDPHNITPPWEDATMSVLQSTAHVFENKAQYGVHSGLNLRITVQRNNAVGECWVSGIGGNFE